MLSVSVVVFIKKIGGIKYGMHLVQCENYREISLLNVVYTISTDTLAQHIKVYNDEILGEYQDTFRQGCSTTDHIFTI
jgi:hypothetical protein